MTRMRSGRWAHEAGLVRWMLLVWFFIFVGAYGLVFALVMSAVDPDPDRAMGIVRAGGFPGLIVALVGAKLMTRKRYQKPQAPPRT